LVCSAAKSTHSADTRSVSFKIHGIDLVKLDGAPIYELTPGTIQNATFHVETLSRRRFGHDLKLLWESVLTYLKIPILQRDISVDEKDWEKVKGVDKLKAKVKSENPRQNGPLQPLDANYLLD
jgi:hypothetical protein